MDLPSFLWLWRAAAWAMGFTIAAYVLLALSGVWLGWRARTSQGTSQRDPTGIVAEIVVDGAADIERLEPGASISERNERQSSEREISGGLRVVHLILGAAIIFLVLFLLAIGIVGTLGHFGSLIHSPHFAAGFIVVGLTIAAAISGLRISPDRRYSRAIHRTIDVALCIALVIVTYTGWEVVQKYLPPG